MATLPTRTALFSFVLLLALSARASAPAGRYIAQGEVMVDRETKLMWQKLPPANKLAFADAKAYCAGITLNGRPGWRLPTMRELATLVDVRAHDPAIDLAAFPNTPVDGYWTSTAYQGSSGLVWKVDFASGIANGASVALPLRVRCVQ